MPQAINEAKDALTGKVTREVIPWTKDTLKKHLAAVRYEREIAGITVAGVPIATERGDHRIVMQNLMLQAGANPEFTIRLKTNDGFVTLDATQILTACTRMLTYIATCFAVEDQLIQQIDATTTTEELDAIEASLSNVWPTQEYE